MHLLTHRFSSSVPTAQSKQHLHKAKTPQCDTAVKWSRTGICRPGLNFSGLHLYTSSPCKDLESINCQLVQPCRLTGNSDKTSLTEGTHKLYSAQHNFTIRLQSHQLTGITNFLKFWIRQHCRPIRHQATTTLQVIQTNIASVVTMNTSSLP
eukprot:GHUV01022119.1.p1 GENE.GHUV01022119.1~~GHUV01022119.1.p1  ORF type:complete len:152 (-),score=19.22 GHUV01022119.1:813-1268(-)